MVQDKTAYNPLDMGMLKRIQTKDENITTRSAYKEKKTFGTASLNAWMYVILYGMVHAFDRSSGKKKMLSNSGDVALWMLFSCMEGCR